MKKTIVMFTLSIVVAFAAHSQSQTVRADSRQIAQRDRLHQGVGDGELTRREANALHSEQRSVRRTERRAKADGDVTAREKTRIERKQDRASRHIRRAKRNKIEPQ